MSSTSQHRYGTAPQPAVNNTVIGNVVVFNGCHGMVGEIADSYLIDLAKSGNTYAHLSQLKFTHSFFLYSCCVPCYCRYWSVACTLGVSFAHNAHTQRENLVHSSNHSVVCSSSAHGSVCSTRAHVFVCGRLMVLLISHSCVISTQHCPLSVLLVSITTRTCSTVRRRLPASTPTSLGSCRMRAFLRVRLASRSVSQTFEQWPIKRRMAVPSLALQNVNSGSGCGDIITSRRSVQRKGWRHSQKWCDAPDSTD